MYISPHAVKSPKEHWLLIDVVVERPGWSLAVGEWDGDRCLAARWNGDDDRPKGNPVSHGMPTWFVLPPEFVEPLLAGLEGRNLISRERGQLTRSYLGVGKSEPLDLPSHDLGPWPETASLRREEIYGDDGR